MKSLLKFSFLVAIVLTSFTAFAKDDNFSLKVNSSNKKSIVFFINDSQHVDLTIYTSSNEVVYEQKIHAVGASKKVYNLDEFPNGNYLVELRTPLKVTTYDMSIEDGKTLVSKPMVKELFKPAIVKEKQTVTLSFNNQVKGAVEVIVFNEYNDQLYRKSYTQASLIQRFDLSKTNAKELIFVVKYRGDEYIEAVSVR
ncbi:MAG: hypothetical protein EOO90_07480 [Pedobacter sp.]|nr:MAG: hypothetical protein EOO90_07480 [Pedobacter sp.]